MLRIFVQELNYISAKIKRFKQINPIFSVRESQAKIIKARKRKQKYDIVEFETLLPDNQAMQYKLDCWSIAKNVFEFEQIYNEWPLMKVYEMLAINLIYTYDDLPPEK